ncbi:hypothetical protein cyc_03768 [Cyclospora cayetanensis]|uniref:Uncharacterized protein n=1 Tax=Cyclospora cayetanensis TaxID=88456 RepID=A0A1D3CY20_9EIME|nr:hypothetical protein cyc_03768 [Cyclospora cayetanensis]
MGSRATGGGGHTEEANTWHAVTSKDALQNILEIQAEAMSSDALLLVPPIFMPAVALLFIEGAIQAMKGELEKQKKVEAVLPDTAAADIHDSAPTADAGPDLPADAAGAGQWSASPFVSDASEEVLSFMIRVAVAAQRRLELEINMREARGNITLCQLLNYYALSSSLYKEEALALQQAVTAMGQRRLQAVVLPAPEEEEPPVFPMKEILTLEQVSAAARLCWALHEAFAKALQYRPLQAFSQCKGKLDDTSSPTEQAESHNRQQENHKTKHVYPQELEIDVLLHDLREDVHEKLQMSLGLQKELHTELATQHIPLEVSPLWLRIAVVQTDFLCPHYLTAVTPSLDMGYLRGMELAFYRMQALFSLRGRILQEDQLLRNYELRSSTDVHQAATLRAQEFEYLAFLTKTLETTLRALSAVCLKRRAGRRRQLLQRQRLAAKARGEKPPSLAEPRRPSRPLVVAGLKMRYSELEHLRIVLFTRAAALRELAAIAARGGMSTIVARGRSLLAHYHSRLSAVSSFLYYLEMGEASLMMFKDFPVELVKALSKTVLLPDPLHSENGLW